MQQLLACAFPQDLKGVLTFSLKTMGTDLNAWCPSNEYLLIVLLEVTDFTFEGVWNE